MGLRAWAPGRVNLIGDHTDYMGGLALPMAIGLGTEITGDRGGNWVMLGSDGFDGVAEIPLEGVPDPATVEPRWARYVAAVVHEVRPRDGLVGMVHSTLPAGSGLASSARSRWRWPPPSAPTGSTRWPPPRRASGPRRRRSACPAGSWTSSCRSPRSRGRRCASTATPGHRDGAVPRRRRGRRHPLGPAPPAVVVGLRRAPGRVRGGRADRGPPARRLARRRRAHRRPRPARRARHVTTENERVDALTSALGQGPARLRRRAAGRQPRQHARRLRGVDPRPRRDRGRRPWRPRGLRRPGHGRRVRRVRDRAVPPEDPAQHAGGVAGPPRRRGRR